MQHPGGTGGEPDKNGVSMTTPNTPPATRRRTLVRLIPAGLVTLALVLVLVFNPVMSRVYASNVFGSLRAPGEPAFVAGHRGDRSVAPENTIPALQAAIASQMAFVETDLQLTADGVPVLLHDETVDRTTNGTGRIADLTLASVRSLDAGSWYSKEFADTRIPTLEEFLVVFAPSRKQLLLELKGFWEKEEVAVVVELIRSRGVDGRVTLASFDFTTLMNSKSVAPSMPLVIIQRMMPADPVGLADHFGAIAILTSAASLEADPTAVERMHEAGLGVLVYTLNSTERWSEAIALGVDGIVTDKPSSLDKWLAETAPGT